MKKLFAVVAVAALALTSAAPVVQAASSTAQMHKPAHSNVHKVAQKKKAKAKTTKKKASNTLPAVGAPKA